jgi:hypothetical protein
LTFKEKKKIRKRKLDSWKRYDRVVEESSSDKNRSMKFCVD